MRDYEKDKKPKIRRATYIVWWHPPGQIKVEDIPIYDKKVAKRDGSFYENLYGAGRGGYYTVGKYDDKPKREKRY